jgi:hypothetical protein
MQSYDINKTKWNSVLIPTHANANAIAPNARPTAVRLDTTPFSDLVKRLVTRTKKEKDDTSMK